MGGSSAPSVPDYSQQNQALVNAENLRREGQALAYNGDIATLNQGAYSAFNQSKSFLNDVKGWDYNAWLKATNSMGPGSGYWTVGEWNPTSMSFNGTNYGTHSLQLPPGGATNGWVDQSGVWDSAEFGKGYQTLMGNFDKLNGYYDQLKAPNFAPTIQGADRGLTVNTPTLNSYKGQDYINQLNNLYQQTNTQLSGYDQRLAQEKSSIGSTMSGWSNALSQLQDQIGSMNINNIDDMGASMRAKIKQGLTSLSGISGNTLYDYLKGNNQLAEYNFNGSRYADYVNNISGGYVGLLGQLDKLDKDRAAEAARVTSYQQSTNNAMQALYNRLSNAGLADYNNIYKDASKQFGDLQQKVGAFNSTYEGYNANTQSQWLTKLQNELVGYKGAYDQENQRVKSYQDSITNQLDQYQNAIGGLGIADDKAMGNYGRYLDTLQQQMGRFTSELGVNWDNQNATLGTMRGQLTDLGTKRTNELKRIDDFQKQFGLDLSGLSTDIDGAGINSADKIDALRTRYNSLADQLAGFSSELNPQMNTQLTQLGREQMDLENLSNKRSQALMTLENQIATMQAQAKQAERDLISMDGSVDGANYRDLTALNNLRQQIAERQQTAQDWRDELAAMQEKATTMGYTPQTDGLAKAQGSLNKLGGEAGYSSLLGELSTMQTKRQGEIDTINSTLSGLQGKVTDAPIQNETDLKSYLTDLSKHLSSLGQYTGNDLTAVSKGYNDAITSVNDKLTQLATKRTEIEKKAQEMLKRMNQTGYYNLGLVDGEKGGTDDLQSTIELYNAQQAMDEMDAIKQRLTSERQRIESDLQKSKAAAAAEAAAVNGQQNPNLPNYGGTGSPLTEAEYLALLQQRKEKELYGGASSFAAAMGLV